MVFLFFVFYMLSFCLLFLVLSFFDDYGILNNILQYMADNMGLLFLPGVRYSPDY